MDENKLLELTRVLNELIYEVAELKDRVARLEGKLWEQTVQPPQQAAEVDESVQRKIMAENYESLGALYQAGYHVCPEFFGQALNDECLFCVALMSRQ